MSLLMCFDGMSHTMPADKSQTSATTFSRISVSARPGVRTSPLCEIYLYQPSSFVFSAQTHDRHQTGALRIVFIIRE